MARELSPLTSDVDGNDHERTREDGYDGRPFRHSSEESSVSVNHVELVNKAIDATEVANPRFVGME
jgi:hypothetical protein